MKDANARIYKFIIFMVILVLSFILSKTIFESFFEPPIIDDPSGAPAAGLFNIIVHSMSFVMFLPIMVFFTVLFSLIVDYFIKRFDLFT